MGIRTLTVNPSPVVRELPDSQKSRESKHRRSQSSHNRLYPVDEVIEYELKGRGMGVQIITDIDDTQLPNAIY